MNENLKKLLIVLGLVAACIAFLYLTALVLYAFGRGEGGHTIDAQGRVINRATGQPDPLAVVPGVSRRSAP